MAGQGRRPRARGSGRRRRHDRQGDGRNSLAGRRHRARARRRGRATVLPSAPSSTRIDGARGRPDAGSLRARISARRRRGRSRRVGPRTGGRRAAPPRQAAEPPKPVPPAPQSIGAAPRSRTRTGPPRPLARSRSLRPPCADGARGRRRSATSCAAAGRPVASPHEDLDAYLCAAPPAATGVGRTRPRTRRSRRSKSSACAAASPRTWPSREAPHRAFLLCRGSRRHRARGAARRAERAASEDAGRS